MQTSLVKSKQGTSVTNLSCGCCGKQNTKVNACSKCHFENYCDKNCQTTHWPKHRLVCQLLPSRNGLSQKSGVFWHSFVQTHQNEVEKWSSSNKIESEIASSTYFDMLELALENLSKIPATDKKVAFDLGCGGGSFSGELLKRGWNVIAVDKQSRAIESVKNRIDKLNPDWLKSNQLTTKLAPIEDYTLKDRAHLVVAMDVLPYCNPSQLRNIWNKIYNALDDENGLLIGTFFTRIQDIAVNMLAMKGAWFIQDIAMVRNLLESTSFEILVCRQRPKKEPSCVIEFCARKKPKD